MAETNADELRRGDLCHHGSNALPLYRVIHTEEGKAWVRDVNTGADSVVEVNLCQRAPVSHERRPDDSHEPPPGPTPINWPDGTHRP